MPGTMQNLSTSFQSGINEIPERGELYWESYRLCYIRSPEGIVVELAEQIG